MLSIMIALPAHLPQQREAADKMYLALPCGGIDLLRDPCILNQSLSHGKLQCFNFHERCLQGRRQGDTRDASLAPCFTPHTRARPSSCADAR